jgi:beta-lactamase class A
MRLPPFLVALFLLALCTAALASAQVPREQVILQTLFSEKTIDASLFATAFTDRVPLSTVQTLVDGYRQRLGELKSVAKDTPDYQLTFASGSLRATIALDAAGKIATLILHDEVSATNAAALEKVLRAEKVSSDWFAPSFLAQVPAAALDAGLGQMRTQWGGFVRIELRNGAYYSVFEKGESHTQISLDSDGKITLLYLAPFTVRTSSLDDALEKLRAGPADVSYLILQGRTEVAALSAARPMAVGSAFKLAVLALLQEQISKGRRRWSDVVPLAARNKSLPSGILQNWPDGFPITLATYAADMISISDNTAADTLIHVVGRAALERAASRNVPFLTTREMFALKSKNVALRETYRRSDLNERRAILAKIDLGPAPALVQMDLSPSDVDLEWYFSVRELCRLMDRVEALPLMTINPGIPSGRWKRIAYKGGSDAGALNFTSFLTSFDGKTYCVSATWNDRKRPVDEKAAQAVFASVLDQLASNVNVGGATRQPYAFHEALTRWFVGTADRDESDDVPRVANADEDQYHHAGCERE